MVSAAAVTFKKTRRAQGVLAGAFTEEEEYYD
jgi:hypothetical protein